MLHKADSYGITGVKHTMPLTAPLHNMLPVARDELLEQDLMYGLELEYENMEVPEGRIPLWNITGDGSLRNGGIEYVSVPLNRDELSVALDTLATHLDGENPDPSPRCGIHVHMNMRPNNVGQLFSFLTAYVLLEPSIFQHFCPERITSSFCVPVYKNNFMVNRAHDAVQAVRRGGRNPLNTLLNTSKYSALNVASLSRFGTVEARQLPATLDFRTLRRWISMLTRLYDGSLRYEDPARVIAIYDGLGLQGFQDTMLNFRVNVNPREQRQAYCAASVIAGYPEPTMDDLEWTLRLQETE